MANALKVEPRDWISIGKIDAVVVQVYDLEGQTVEAVYFDQKRQAINEDVVWDGKTWKFKIEGPCGGYADKSPRLKEFVGVLKRGRGI